MQPDSKPDYFKEAMTGPAESFGLNLPEANPDQVSHLEWLNGLGEEWLRQADNESARQVFHLVLKIEPGNERATFGFINTAKNWNVIRNMLQILLRVHPENIQAKAWLEEAQNRLQNVGDLDDIVNSSSFIKNWTDREKEYNDRIRFNYVNTEVISKMGQLLLHNGYLSLEQLENGLALQTMFERFGTKEKLGKVLVDNGYIKQEQLDHVVSLQEEEYNKNMW